MSKPMVRMQFGITPFPPPLHACFVNVVRNGRADSARYKAFKQTVDQHLAVDWRGTLGKPDRPTISGDVAVIYIVQRPDKRARDLDNLLKALNDTLVRNHIISDDCKISDLHIRWASTEDAMRGNSVFVIVEQIEHRRTLGRVA